MQSLLISTSHEHRGIPWTHTRYIIQPQAYYYKFTQTSDIGIHVFTHIHQKHNQAHTHSQIHMPKTDHRNIHTGTFSDAQTPCTHTITQAHYIWWDKHTNAKYRSLNMPQVYIISILHTHMQSHKSLNPHIYKNMYIYIDNVHLQTYWDNHIETQQRPTIHSCWTYLYTCTHSHICTATYLVRAHTHIHSGNSTNLELCLQTPRCYCSTIIWPQNCGKGCVDFTF